MDSLTIEVILTIRIHMSGITTIVKHTKDKATKKLFFYPISITIIFKKIKSFETLYQLMKSKPNEFEIWRWGEGTLDWKFYCYQSVLLFAFGYLKNVGFQTMILIYIRGMYINESCIVISPCVYFIIYDQFYNLSTPWNFYYVLYLSL